MSIYFEKLKDLRTSKNRDDVLDIMESSSCPVSVEEIFEKIKKNKASISISTIYRIIDKLSELNVVRVAATLDDNKARYELVRENHHHYMICKKCKKMIPINICPLEELEHKIADEAGFTITGHKFELYGECKDCAGKEKENKK